MLIPRSGSGVASEHGLHVAVNAPNKNKLGPPSPFEPFPQPSALATHLSARPSTFDNCTGEHSQLSPQLVA